MLKHKDRRAMNLNDFVVLPNSAAKSVKLNARKLQELKMVTGSLTEESDEMEEKLKRLKERMSQEKEERTHSGGFRWKSGHQSLMNNASSMINSKRNDNRLQKLSAGRVKMLKDEPRTAAPPPSPAPVGTMTTRRIKPRGTACGQCDARTAEVKCAECSEDYCIPCFSQLHQKGALKLHSAVPIQTEPQTHVSAQDVVSCLPTQPNPSSNPATFSSPNPRPSPTHTQRAASDAFTDQRPGHAAAARHTQIQDNRSQVLNIHNEENGKAENASSLLDGLYDEKESAKSFQEAVRQWREARPAQELMWTPPVTVSDAPTQADLSPGAGGAGGRVPVKVEFAEYGLTLLDRLLLKKHRRAPLEVPPCLTDSHVKPVLQSLEKDPEPSLTVEDGEVRSYLTSLFAAPTTSQRTGLENSAPEVCFSIEVLDEEDKAVKAETKTWVNRILPSPQPACPKSSHCSSAAPRSVRSADTQQTKTPCTVGPDSAKPQSAPGPQGNRRSSIKTGSSKPRKPTPRSHTNHGSQGKSRGSLESPLLSFSAPLYRRTHNAPRSPCDPPSTGRSSETSESYPSIPPVLRTTFTVTPSSSVRSALLPNISADSTGRGRSRTSRQSQRASLEGSVQSVSSRNSQMSHHESVGLCKSGSVSLDGGVKLGHEATGFGSQSKQILQHFISAAYLNDSVDEVPTERNETASTDSEDEMSSDSLDLARDDENCTDEDDCLDSGRSRDDRGNPASFHLDEDFVPAHEERERDLPTDGAQQLSEPARLPSLWSDSDDSDDYSLDSYRNLHPKTFDAMHHSRTSLDTSTAADLSQAAVLELSGCEDPDMEADMTNHTMSRLERELRELRQLASETGPEVFAAAPGNSRAQHPRGSRLYTRRKLSKEEQDEEEAVQNDLKSVLLLP